MKQISFDDALDMNLSDRQVRLATGGARHGASRRDIENAILETFELIGGVPRLAMWANDPDNYGEFLKLAAKLFPKEEGEAKGKIIYQSSIPASSLNKGQIQTIENEE
jgi:hypothetical protein